MPEQCAFWYSGSAHGLVWPHGLALLDGSVAPEAVDAVWLRAPDAPGEFVKAVREITGCSVTNLPGFAVAFGRDTQWRIAVRGGLQVSVACRGEVIVAAHDGPQWGERQLDGVERVGLSLRADAVATGAVGRPIVAGVAPAIALLRTVPVSPLPTDAPRAAQSKDGTHPLQTSAPVLPARLAKATLAPRTTQVAPTTETAGSSAIPGSFAHLWDTMLGTASLPSPDQASTSAAALPMSAASPALSPSAESSGLRLGDHDDLTILGPPVAPASGTPSVVSQPGSVLARQCAQGHANPPDRTTCRACGKGLDAPATQVPQPVLGRAVLASGRVIELNGPVILGRQPEAKRVTDGPLPQLVALPTNHISRNHVRLLPEGWQVSAVDLNSTNGTLLRRPGESSVRLPQRPVPLRSGDVLDFGHGVLLTFEDLP